MQNLVSRIRDRRRKAEVATLDDTMVLCDRPGLTVAVPLTEDAAKSWGRGTRWPAAASSDNSFRSQNVTAPFVVAIMSDTKLSLWMSPAGPQLRDVADRDVTPDFIAARWDELEPLVRWALDRDPAGMLPFLPYSLRDRHTCMEAVLQDGMALRHAHEALRDREMCLSAVRQNGRALEHVHPALRDAEMSLEAVRQDWRAFEHVHPALRGLDIYEELLKQNPHAVDLVPPHLHDLLPVAGILEQQAKNHQMVLAGVGLAPVISELPDLNLDINSEEVKQNGFMAALNAALKRSMSDRPSPVLPPVADVDTGDVFDLSASAANLTQFSFLPDDPTTREFGLAAVAGNGREPWARNWTPEDALDGLAEALAEHAAAPSAPRR